MVQNLEKGNEALKSLNALLNVEHIEQMLQETQEGAEKQREINDLIVGFAGEIEVSSRRPPRSTVILLFLAFSFVGREPDNSLMSTSTLTLSIPR